MHFCRLEAWAEAPPLVVIAGTLSNIAGLDISHRLRGRSLRGRFDVGRRQLHAALPSPARA